MISDNFAQHIANLHTMVMMWNKHALQRMLERSISRSEVKKAIRDGKVIEIYSDDYLYPSCLIANITVETPIHVVISISEEDNTMYIITAYIPDTNHFENDLITRKKNEK